MRDFHGNIPHSKDQRSNAATKSIYPGPGEDPQGMGVTSLDPEDGLEPRCHLTPEIQFLCLMNHVGLGPLNISVSSELVCNGLQSYYLLTFRKSKYFSLSSAQSPWLY